MPLSIFNASVKRPHEELLNLLAGGVVNFAFIALMGSVWVDIVLQAKEDGQLYSLPLAKEIVFILMPIILTILVVAAYVLVLTGILDENYFIRFDWSQNLVTSFAFAYCILIKIDTFIKEEI
jgi:biotin transporter BioY